jgi:hypothetical protein
MGNAQQRTEPQFVLNPDRAYLYIQFDHFGPGVPRNENEPPNRVWLRLVNNCTITVKVRVNGFPEGHEPPDEIALMDQVLPDPPHLRTGSSTHPDSRSAAQGRTPSLGYGSDVGSTEYVRAGQSILFSLPTTQFANDWHIEIPYDFVVPDGKGPRPDEIGGQPVMYISYALPWLPQYVQEQIRKENTHGKTR